MGLYVLINISDSRHNNALQLCWVSNFIYYFAEYRYADCRYAECRYAECRDTVSYNKIRKLQTRAQCYKTFSFRNLLIFEIMFVPGKVFQPSLMFVSEAGAYPSGISFQVLSSRVGSCLIHKH